ncbi:unnamed protein product [Rhizophagus irregularis]|nr:unnamed protein product [Rhizophagus irregularis]
MEANILEVGCRVMSIEKLTPITRTEPYRSNVHRELTRITTLSGCNIINTYNYLRRPTLCLTEAIIIHLDEYQLYINDVQQYQKLSWIDSRDFFKAMLREIGSVMRCNFIKNEYNGKYFIIPICTGTSAIDVHFLPTEHTQEMLELRPLNYDSAKSMFLDKYDYSKQTTDKGRDLMVQGITL